MLSNEAEYFLERAIIEREMAKAANHPNAVAAHEKMAQQYDALIIERMRPAFQIQVR